MRSVIEVYYYYYWGRGTARSLNEAPH